LRIKAENFIKIVQAIRPSGANLLLRVKLQPDNFEGYNPTRASIKLTFCITGQQISRFIGEHIATK